MATPATEPATPGGPSGGGASPYSSRTTGGEARVESRGSRWSLGPILSIVAGLALIAVGIAALIRTGVNETWFRPVTEIFEADHTPLLAAIEIGAGVLLVALGLLRNRLLIAIAGIAGALLATVAAVDPQEVSRELAINRWWAWVLAGTGALLALASLHRRGERTREVETAGGARYRRRYGDYAAPA